MEIMEDGNLVDRVRILLQRDMQYYEETQTVLREPLCIRVSGGKLDFPRHASFAAIKIVTWWEAEFVTAFKQASGISYVENFPNEDDEVIKRIKPEEFSLLVVDTAEQLMEHLNTLVQEALDHADLTVLTATLGAAALVRNCLWCYNQHVKGVIAAEASGKLSTSYKSFNELTEAVAERLLDLHCRLISLYVLNEADSLNWQSDRVFFEKERCSFVIQMWWFYMQGTKMDLWNTVSPKMAQRIFSGMLNESLSIIMTRFNHGRPSLARSDQFWTDAFNVLRCMGCLALAACVSGDEMIGIMSNKLPVAIRDIHAKCNEILISLLIRGTPITELYQEFRNGIENLTILQPQCGPAPWILVCAPNILGLTQQDINIVELYGHRAVILEINVLRHQPQPNWPQLLKIVSMNDYAVGKMLMKSLVKQCIGYIVTTTSGIHDKLVNEQSGCQGFLCPGISCPGTMKITAALGLYSLTHILTVAAKEPGSIIVPILKEDPMWASYLTKQQVWNQARPPWLNAIIHDFKEMMYPIVEILLDAVKTGASVYQAMSLVLGCFSELYTFVPIGVLHTAFALNDNLPADCYPIGGSVLLQLMCSSLYSALHDASVKSLSSDSQDELSITVALAEAVCCIDEDNKHTMQIESFLLFVQKSVKATNCESSSEKMEDVMSITKTYVDELLFTNNGRHSLKITYEYLVRVSDWVLINLRNAEKGISENLMDSSTILPMVKPLTYIMFHIEDVNFDEFLINYKGTNWSKVFSLPLSLTSATLCKQTLLRPEFKDTEALQHEERHAVKSIKQMCSKMKSSCLK